MPVIHEYTAPSPISVLRPDASGAQALSSEGRVGEEMAYQSGRVLGSGVANLGRSIVNGAYGWAKQADVSSMTSKLTDLNTQMMQQYRAESSSWSASDPTAGQKFLSDYRSKAEAITQSAYSTDGEEFGNRLASHFQEHLANTILSDAGVRGGNAVLASMHSQMLAAQSAVAADPSSIETQVEAIKASYHAQIAANPELDASQIGALHRGYLNVLAHVGVSGMQAKALANPNEFLNEVNRGEWDSFVPRSQALAYGIQQQRIVESEQRSQEYLNLALQRQNQDNLSATILSNAFRAGPNGSITIDPSVLTNISKNVGGLGPAYTRTMSVAITALQRQRAGAYTPDDPHVVQNIRNNLILSPTDKNFPTNAGILHQVFAGNISPETGNTLTRDRALILNDPGLRRSYGLAASWVKTHVAALLPPNFTTQIEGGNNAFTSRVGEFQSSIMNGVVDAYHSGGSVGVQKFLADQQQHMGQWAVTSAQLTANVGLPPPDFGPASPINRPTSAEDAAKTERERQKLIAAHQQMQPPPPPVIPGITQ